MGLRFFFMPYSRLWWHLWWWRRMSVGKFGATGQKMRHGRRQEHNA
jgi:hypothetical protein